MQVPLTEEKTAIDILSSKSLHVDERACVHVCVYISRTALPDLTASAETEDANDVRKTLQHQMFAIVAVCSLCRCLVYWTYLIQ